jgi:hypothetical protein
VKIYNIEIIPTLFKANNPGYPNVKNICAIGFPSTPIPISRTNIVVRISKMFNNIKRQNHLCVFKKEKSFVKINSEERMGGSPFNH